jgi:hypothetical protein
MIEATVRKAAILAVLGSALLMTGCGDLVSLHPLYTGQDRVFDAALEGRWEDDDNLLTVERIRNAYEVVLRSKKDPSEQQTYEVHLVDIGGVRFADILPTGGILGHMFLKVRVSASDLRIAFFESAWLLERVPYEPVPVARGNRQAVLIARTPELRKQVEKYATAPEAYDDEIRYRRAPAAAPQ